MHVLKSKLHRARVSGGSPNYEGSLRIDRELMDTIGMVPYERILCGNMAGGEHFETCAIPGRRGVGSIPLNGATARPGKAGDLPTIMSFVEVDEHAAKHWKPGVVVLGGKNRIVKNRGI